MSKWRPSRPTRRWRKSTGRPVVTSTARLMSAAAAPAGRSATAAATHGRARTCSRTASPSVIASPRPTSGSAPRCSTRDAAALDLEEPRHDRDVDAELPAAAHEVEHHGVRRGREGDHDAVDAVVRDDALEIPARAEDRERPVAPRPRRSGSLSRNPTGCRPSAGSRSGAWPSRCPIAPAPTIRVRRRLAQGAEGACGVQRPARRDDHGGHHEPDDQGPSPSRSSPRSSGTAMATRDDGHQRHGPAELQPDRELRPGRVEVPRPEGDQAQHHHERCPGTRRARTGPRRP